MSSSASRLFLAPLLLFTAGLVAAADVPSLTLEVAVRTALARDAVRAQYVAQAEAARNRAITAGTWPDPELSFGVQNVPTDSFALNADPMTMVMLGIRQQIPAGDSAELGTQLGMQRAQVYVAQADERRREVARQVRGLWFRIAYTRQALADARAAHERFTLLLDTVTAGYAQGGVRQQAVLRIRGALGTVTESVLQLEVERERLHAELVRWVGSDLAQQPLAGDAQLPAPAEYSVLLAALVRHPALAMRQAALDASQTTIALAQEAYAPEWSLSVQYGARQGYAPMSNMPNDDMVSAMVSMSLPLFTGDRQDRRVTAARAQSRATEFAYQDELRQLRARLDAAWAAWQHYRRIETLYHDELLPVADSRARAAQAAYETGTGDLELLIETRLALLQTRTQSARSTLERAQAQTELLYFSGDSNE